MPTPASVPTHFSPAPSGADAETIPFLRIRDLHKQLGTQQILKGVNLEAHHGDSLTIIGRSGEGKSVLTRHILGFMSPDSGEISIDGVNIVGLTERKLAVIRRRIGVLFQHGALFDSLSVAENVAFPLIEIGEKDRATIQKRIDDVLDAVGMSEHREKMPPQLSGGQRKRIALARAVIARPRCVIYDEPTSGLDPIASDSIARLISRISRRYAVTSLVITHDMKVLEVLGGHVAFLSGGQIAFHGTPEEMHRSPDQTLQNFVHGRSGE